MKSILNQTYENIDIYIRDDGSKDEIVAQIESLQKENKTGKRIILLDNEGKNLRCPGSFYEILRKCGPAEYYSLCDQDDLWYPEKIEWAVERLQKEDKRQLLFYFSSYDYYTSDGKFIRHSPEQKDNIGLEDVLYYTPGSGFTILINEKARQEMILDVDPGQELHDRWLIRGAACFGKILYDKRSTARHIRHEVPVTAADSGNANLMMNFIKNELCGRDIVRDKEYSGYFYKTFSARLSNEQRKVLTLFTEEGFSI